MFLRPLAQSVKNNKSCVFDTLRYHNKLNDYQRLINKNYEWVRKRPRTECDDDDDEDEFTGLPLIHEEKPPGVLKHMPGRKVQKKCGDEASVSQF